MFRAHVPANRARCISARPFASSLQDASRHTSLHVAVARSDAAFVQILMESGHAGIESRDNVRTDAVRFRPLPS